METRKLGYTDLDLSTIGFGAWAIGGGNWEWGWGPQDDLESEKSILKALDLGINWIDTAAAYGLGHSEEIVGKILKDRREQVTIATKCSLVWEDPRSGKISNRLKAWSVRKEAEESLLRLNTDVIDLYQIHWPNPDVDIEEGWGEIARLVQEGKVRYAGVSNFDVSQLKRIQPIHPVASLQPPYNLFEREFEDELMTYCRENNIGVVAYSPMASGLLTGKYTLEKVLALPPEDWRVTKSEHFQEPELSVNLDTIEKLTQISTRYGRSLGELAVAWVLRNQEVTSAIVGARRPDQIAQIAPASDWKLELETIEEIEAILQGRSQALTSKVMEI
jgi:aryl-alcohol dehydrogenase-like predicted oxidoreductase